MTSIPLVNFPAFDYAALQWKDAGWEVVNPADLTREFWRERFGREFDPTCTDPEVKPGGSLYREFLKRDIAAILDCRAIAVLPGWRASKGVALELTVARALNLPVYDAVTFQPIAEESALEEAQRLVHGDRQASYGHPLHDYTRTGRMWGAILDGWLRAQPGFESIPPVPDIDPRIGCLMMVGVKLSREVNAPRRDNRVDGAGYFECAHMVAERQAVQP